MGKLNTTRSEFPARLDAKRTMPMKVLSMDSHCDKSMVTPVTSLAARVFTITNSGRFYMCLGR